MATPTLSELRAIAVAWWREPGVPRLDVLDARLAATFTDAGAIVRSRVENRAGVYTLVVELERGGAVVSREWTPTAGERQDTLGDVFCGAYGTSLRDVEARG